MSRPARAVVDVERRTALNGARLAGLVAGRWGAADRQRGALGATATLLDPPAAGGTRRAGWVLPDGPAARALGPALVWADRHGVADLHVLAEPGASEAGTLARQASLFADGPTVWAVEGTTLAPAAPVPAPRPVAPPAPPELVDLLIDAGLEIVAEGGMLRGEVNGLEVARIVQDETTAGVLIDEPQIEVGVGKADRELTAMVHGGMAPVAQIERVAAIVRRHRRPGAPRHPLNQLVPDRWLRAVLCRAPHLVGLASLRPAEGPRPRPDLSERDIAVAAGRAPDGSPAVVACSVGVAADLVPVAADARATIDPAARLLLAVPERDDHPATRRLTARLRAPAEVVPVPGDWRAAA
ncbi:MAG TPA: hypothetical protein VFZ77_02915 [Acidimicrobiales bacterium]